MSSTQPPPERTDDAVREARAQALQRKQLETVPVAETPAVSGEVPASVMANVRNHLSGRTGAPPDAFQVVRAQEQEWPNGALGCPQPGLIYPQRPITGYWIVLRHGEREYDYRVAESGLLVLCEGMVLEDPPPR